VFGPNCHAGQQFGESHTRHGSADGFEDTANVFGGIGFGVEQVNVAGRASVEDANDPFSTRSLGTGFCGT
jgi:hypothetical protein